MEHCPFHSLQRKRTNGSRFLFNGEDFPIEKEES
jgi:hypothetical protein